MCVYMYTYVYICVCICIFISSIVGKDNDTRL